MSSRNGRVGVTAEIEKGSTFEYQRGIAKMAWPDEGLELRFELMRLDRRTGEISAEVTALWTVGGGTDLLHRARLNLLSTRGRAEMVKHLEHRWKGPEWGPYLEVASHKTVEAHREGPPAILLRDAKEPPAAGELLPPLLVPDDAVIWFGDGGTAKSYLGLAAAISVHSGQPMLAWLKPKTRLRVAYLDFEWREWPHHKRMRALWGDTELPDLVYVPCQSGGPLSQQVERLRRIFSEHRIEYAVVDSVGLACDGPPEEAASALGFFGALGQLEVGSLLLAHINRGHDTERPFGSIFWHNSARLTWYLQGAQDAGSKAMRVSMFNRKNSDGPRHRPLGLAFDFGERTMITGFEVERAAPDSGPRPGPTILSRVVDLLRDAGDGCTYAEAAETLGVTESNVRAAVSRDGGVTIRVFPDPGDRRLHRLALQEPKP